MDISADYVEELFNCFEHLFSNTDLNPLHVMIDVAAARGLGPLTSAGVAHAQSMLQQQPHFGPYSSTVHPFLIGGVFPSIQQGTELNPETLFCPTEFDLKQSICWHLTAASQPLTFPCHLPDASNATNTSAEAESGTLYSTVVYSTRE